jgi:hypothetical protein
MQAMADVSEMARELMSACESAMAITNCDGTGSDGHDAASATFDEAASKLEELGFVHEITLDGVVFSRTEPDAGEYGPDTKIAAAPFLGLGGAVELGSLDQVVGVAAYKGLNRCPVLVCPNVKVDGAKSTYYKFCANPSKFHSNQQRAALLRSAQVYLPESSWRS